MVFLTYIVKIKSITSVGIPTVILSSKTWILGIIANLFLTNDDSGSGLLDSNSGESGLRTEEQFILTCSPF